VRRGLVPDVTCCQARLRVVILSGLSFHQQFRMTTPQPLLSRARNTIRIKIRSTISRFPFYNKSITNQEQTQPPDQLRPSTTI